MWATRHGHPLIRETVFSELSMAKRTSTHGNLARALEQPPWSSDDRAGCRG